MCFAFTLMKKQLTKCSNIEFMAKLYEEVRKDISLYMKERNVKDSPMKKVKADSEKYARRKVN